MASPKRKSSKRSSPKKKRSSPKKYRARNRISPRRSLVALSPRPRSPRKTPARPSPPKPKKYDARDFNKLSPQSRKTLATMIEEWTSIFTNKQLHEALQEASKAIKDTAETGTDVDVAALEKKVFDAMEKAMPRHGRLQ